MPCRPHQCDAIRLFIKKILNLWAVCFGICYCLNVFAGTSAPMPRVVQFLGDKVGAYIRASGFASGTLGLPKTIFKTAQKQCRVTRQREARIDSGRLEDVGLWQEDFSYTATQSAIYITAALFVPTKVPCVFHQIVTRMLEVASFDSNRTRWVTYDSAKEDAISQYVFGKRLFTHLNLKTRNGSGTSGFVDAGSFDMVASYRFCNMRAIFANALQEACFLEASGIPPDIQFRQINLDLTSPGKSKHRAIVDRLISAALIVQDVFEAHKSIQSAERT